ncbi:MAG TPA: ABC transporter permease [Actinomycetes bacterium]|nr:ABC transporter permease [Actinomycetes bacterium]
MPDARLGTSGQGKEPKWNHPARRPPRLPATTSSKPGVGLLVPSAEVVSNASGMVIFPLTFIANTFVPAENLPTPLRVVAEWNPVSAVTQAARELFGNIPPGTPSPAAWPLQNAALYTLLWVLIIIAVFAPPAVSRYKKAAAK